MSNTTISRKGIGSGIEQFGPDAKIVEISPIAPKRKSESRKLFCPPFYWEDLPDINPNARMLLLAIHTELRMHPSLQRSGVLINRRLFERAGLSWGNSAGSRRMRSRLYGHLRRRLPKKVGHLEQRHSHGRVYFIPGPKWFRRVSSEATFSAE